MAIGLTSAPHKVLGASVRAVPVHHHRRRDDHARRLLRARRNGLHQRGRAHDIDVRITTNVEHRLTITDHCREVKDDVHVLERGVDRPWVSHVAVDEFGLFGHESRLARRVRLREQVVEHSHAPAVGDERVGEVRANETSASGHERHHGRERTASIAAKAARHMAKRICSSSSSGPLWKGSSCASTALVT